eukprot:GHVS01078368.1.p1 GENE.GHVS01078368.1~~GHVS01078368.1.p1  ORF type:complete len:428 (+),score=12.26 GHVS01078368.1:174-1457(+)
MRKSPLITFEEGCISTSKRWFIPGNWINTKTGLVLIVGFVGSLFISLSILRLAECSPVSTVKVPTLKMELVSNSPGLRRFSSLLSAGMLKQTLPNRFVFGGPPKSGIELPFSCLSGKSKVPRVSTQAAPMWMDGLDAVPLYAVVNDEDQLLLSRYPVGGDAGAIDGGPNYSPLRENFVGLFFLSYRDCHIFMENFKRSGQSSNPTGARIRVISLAHYFYLTRRLRHGYMSHMYPNRFIPNGFWGLIRRGLLTLTRKKYRNDTTGEGSELVRDLANSVPTSTTTLLIVPDMQDLTAACSYPYGRQLNSNTVWNGRGTPVFAVETPKGPKPARHSSSVKMVGVRQSLVPRKAAAMETEKRGLRQSRATIDGTTCAPQTDNTTSEIPAGSTKLRLFFPTMMRTWLGGNRVHHRVFSVVERKSLSCHWKRF